VLDCSARFPSEQSNTTGWSLLDAFDQKRLESWAG
jgi:hypothetical protein